LGVAPPRPRTSYARVPPSLVGSGTTSPRRAPLRPGSGSRARRSRNHSIACAARWAGQPRRESALSAARGGRAKRRRRRRGAPRRGTRAPGHTCCESAHPAAMPAMPRVRYRPQRLAEHAGRAPRGSGCFGTRAPACPPGGAPGAAW
jgi:hypothetical protein